VTGRFQAIFAQRTMIIINIYHALKNTFRLTEQFAPFMAPPLLQRTRSVPRRAWGKPVISS
jgi:hypothetical protein